MANRFHKHFFVLVILSVSIAIGLGKIGNAASFDCNKAKTDVEKNNMNEKEDRKDERTKIQASQQSELIEQRKNNTPPKKFESAGNDILSGDFSLGAFDPK